MVFKSFPRPSSARYSHRLGDAYKSSKEALSEACKNAKQNDFVFIGGSTFVVSEVI